MGGILLRMGSVARQENDEGRSKYDGLSVGREEEYSHANGASY